MSRARHAELPEELRPVLRKAVRLEWLTVAYMASAVVVVGLTLGSSQAMKAVWVEDVLGLLPPIAFLIAVRVRHRPPDDDHPWGHHRVVSLAFLSAALALLLFGLIILGDSLMHLAKAERAPIGVFPLFGHEPWAGWLMLGALVYSGLPPVVLGVMKRRLARQLHDKVLYADAEMNRADWMTAAAGAVGVVGIGFGLWFADAVMGSLIALDIVRDGVRNVKAASAELMDARPTTYDLSEVDPLVGESERVLLACDFVEDALVRLREEGHVLAGEAHLVLRDGEDVPARCEEAAERLLGLSWRLHDVVVAPATPEGLRELRA